MERYQGLGKSSVDAGDTGRHTELMVPDVDFVDVHGVATCGDVIGYDCECARGGRARIGGCGGD